MRHLPGLVVAVTLSMLLTTAASAAITFTRPPTAARSADGVTIQFAVSEPTDVAVCIESADGRIVRHVAAGVIGPGRNSPPFKPDSLEQSLVWDGKADYGKDPGAGPFKIRVALGLGAKFDKVLAGDPQNFGSIKSLAVGPDGTLYVCCGFGAPVPNWTGERIVAVSRDGVYQRTVMPLPANAGKEEFDKLGAVEVGGRPVPLVKNIPRRSFYSSESARKAGMAVTADGVIIRPVGGYSARGPAALSALTTRGTPAWAGNDVGPAMVKWLRTGMARPFVCVSSDGKAAYLTGLTDVRPNAKPAKVDFSCVYRVPLPDRGPATPFVGIEEEPGNDQTHLSSSPRGLAVDGKGNLLIADQGNNRIVIVAEATGKFVAQLATTRPDCIAVDSGTGAIYITRLTGRNVELVKLSGWDEPKELARLLLPPEGDMAQFPWVMALDASARPAIVWAGSDAGGLLRIEDQGDKLVARGVNTRQFGACSFEDVTVDRMRAEPEVYFRTAQGQWVRFNETTGAMSQLKLELPGSAGSCLLAGPDGNLYLPGWPHHLMKFSRDGKAIPWREGYTGYKVEHAGKDGKIATWSGGPNSIFVPVSMMFMTHTLGIRHDGRLFIFEPGHPGDRPPKMLREYTTDGQRVSDTPIIWKVSDTAIGPKFDPQGNIYIAEQIKPLDAPYPPDFAAVVGKVEPGKTYLQNEPIKDAICTMYGSIVKFSPKGGMIHFGGENPFTGQPRLDPSLKTVEAASYSGYRLHPTKVTGAEWIRMGISHVDLFYCNCENTRFDVDPFGRVWVPDLGRFRVGVLDTNGNDITHFGGYGNGDSCGPDTKDKTLAEPEIPLAWLVGVGVTDRYVYMGDSMNRRLLRARIVYATEATCEAK